MAKLAALGITTVRQLAAADMAALAREFGPTTGPWLVLLGNGRGESEVDSTPYVPRSHGREVTYQRNLADWAEVAAESRPPGQAGRGRGHRPPGGQGGGEGPVRARSTRSPTAPRCPLASNCPRALPAARRAAAAR